MNATFTDDWTSIHHGDCLTVMASMPECSIDAIVTDPPYGLSFMGREWDHGVPGEAFWAEALRVAKPGAHLVAFGGTRTYHRLACAIEDAGWEVRDCLGWLYGSGFPKSLDVSKAIDKLDAVDERDSRARRFQEWLRPLMSPQQVNELTGTDMGHHLTTHPTQPAVPTERVFAPLRAVLGDVPSWVEELVAERTVESENYKRREVVAHAEMVDTTRVRMGFAGDRYNDGESATRIVPITAPATEAAQKWQGWGTALKPAWEPVILARKPLTGTVAGNVQRWGTGAINIDGCRVETDENLNGGAYVDGRDPRAMQPGGGKRAAVTGEYRQPLGRWPANIVHDGSDEVLAVFPQTSSSPFVSSVSTGKPHDVYGGGMEDYTGRGFSDSGSAARFFYCAKADGNERNDGIVNGCNIHPTVKPLDLMRWLVRLVTPPDGIVLDPFMGSGTTLKAARAEGHRSIGIDLERDHCEIAWGRLSQGVLL